MWGVSLWTLIHRGPRHLMFGTAGCIFPIFATGLVPLPRCALLGAFRHATSFALCTVSDSAAIDKIYFVFRHSYFPSHSCNSCYLLTSKKRV